MRLIIKSSTNISFFNHYSKYRITKINIKFFFKNKVMLSTLSSHYVGILHHMCYMLYYIMIMLGIFSVFSSLLPIPHHLYEPPSMCLGSSSNSFVPLLFPLSFTFSIHKTILLTLLLANDYWIHSISPKFQPRRRK